MKDKKRIDVKAKDSKGRPKYIYGRLMNVASQGSNIEVTARDVEWNGLGPRIKAYFYPDGYIGWIPRSVVANVQRTAYQGLPDNQDLVNLDKGEQVKKVTYQRFAFIPMNPPSEKTEAMNDVMEEVARAKAENVETSQESRRRQLEE